MGTFSERAGDPNVERLVYVRFRPAWAYLDAIREFTSIFCKTTFDDDMAERARMVIHEMLENAIKYSEEVDLEVTLTRAAAGVELAVTSRPLAQHLAHLRKELTALFQLPAEEAFMRAMERAADLPNGEARLGLARVRLEGRFDLSVEELDDGRVRLVARGNT